MPKKKKIKFADPPQVWNPSFHAHYDELGNVISVSNEKSNTINSIEITYTDYENIVTGKNKLADIKVENGELIYITADKISIKVKKLKLINDSKTPDIEIFWGEHWTFLLTETTRQKFYDKKLIGDSVQLYLTLENEKNYLIRSFNLIFKDLILDKLVIPFESNYEKSINDISLFTDSTLEYKLTISEATND